MKKRKIVSILMGLIVIVVTIAAISFTGESEKEVSVAPQEMEVHQKQEEVTVPKKGTTQRLENPDSLYELWRDTRVAVTLIYDKPVNGYIVTGKFYPDSAMAKTGEVEFRFESLDGRKNFFFDSEEDYGRDYLQIQKKFTGKNICDYVEREDFNGFHLGDTIHCHYHNEPNTSFDSPLYYDAEFQLYDIDFDGEDEFLLNDYSRGENGNIYLPFEIVGDVLRFLYDFHLQLDNKVKFIREHKWIENEHDKPLPAYTPYGEVPLNSIKFDKRYLSLEYVSSLRIAKREFPVGYIDGPVILLNDHCWTYTHTYMQTRGEEEYDIEDKYYVPTKRNIVIRETDVYRHSYLDPGSISKHTVIFKEESDTSYDRIIRDYPWGSEYVSNKKNDIYAIAFERYCKNLLRK